MGAYYDYNSGGYVNDGNSRTASYGLKTGRYHQKQYSRPQVASQLPPKRSGCKVRMVQIDRFDTPMGYVSAWRKTKGGFQVLYARPYKGGDHPTKERVSKSGRKYFNYFVTIVNMTNGAETKCIGFYYPDERKLRIPNLGFIASANASRGGYFGRQIFNNK